ncbi:hypothetical protein ACWY4P_45555 [Streptomyces sp. LZ34]
MGKMNVALMLGGALLLAGTTLSGTATAAPSACGGVSSAEGHAVITTCASWQITGTVYDDKADGRCPRVRAYDNNDKYYYSDWAGPKGDSSPVDIRPDSGAYLKGYYMAYIEC